MSEPEISRTLGGCMWCTEDGCDHGARMAEAAQTLEPDPHGGCPDAGCSPSCPARIYPTIGDDGSVSYGPVEPDILAIAAENAVRWKDALDLLGREEEPNDSPDH